VRKQIVFVCWMLLLPVAAVLAPGCSSQSESGEQHAEAAHQEAAADAEHGDMHGDMHAEAGMTEEQLLHKADPKGTYGTGLTLHESTKLASILADPETYEGKTVQVSGVVQEVCPMRGCWIQMADASESIRVKVTDGEIVFPLSAKDQGVVVEGVVERIDMTEEEYRNWMTHEAEEQGKEFDPASVTGPATIWRIRGEGAKIGS